MTCHTYKHYIHAGSGLRSLADTYVFLRAHPDLDREYLDAELKKLRIADFEEKMRVLSEKVSTAASLTSRSKRYLNILFSPETRARSRTANITR